MIERRTIAQCRWAESTLFLAHPLWTDAADYPWSCTADGDPTVVEDTARCASCGRWASRTPHLVGTCACQQPANSCQAPASSCQPPAASR